MKTYQLEAAGARPAGQSELHIARRTITTSTVAKPNSGGGDSAADLSAVCLYSGAGPVRTPLPEASRPSEPVPIWLAVLLATSCEARGNANTGSGDGPDAGEPLLAELQPRRQRLRKLLRLVWMEVESLPARRAPVRSRARCENVRVRRSEEHTSEL